MIAQRLVRRIVEQTRTLRRPRHADRFGIALGPAFRQAGERRARAERTRGPVHLGPDMRQRAEYPAAKETGDRSEEHTSELQSLMRNSYAVFCLKKKNTQI